MNGNTIIGSFLYSFAMGILYALLKSNNETIEIQLRKLNGIEQ